MPLNSRESLSSRISELGEGSLKDLLIDMNDSSWQWSRNKDSSTSRKRNVIVGGQTVDSSSASANGGSGGSSSGGSSSGGESGGSSTASDQIQSNWKEANPLAKAFIKNKPALGSISSYDFSGDIGDVYFDGTKFVSKDAVSSVRTVNNGNIVDGFPFTISNASGIFYQLFYAKQNLKISDIRICQYGMNTAPVRLSLWTSGQDAVQWTGSIPKFSLINNSYAYMNRGAFIYSNGVSFNDPISKGWYAIGIDVLDSSESVDLVATQSFASIAPDSIFPSLSQTKIYSSQQLPSSFYPSPANNSIQKIWIELTESVQ